MSLGTVGTLKLVEDAYAPGGPIKFTRVTMVGDAAYSAGGSLGFEDAMRVLIGENRRVFDVRGQAGNGDLGFEYTPKGNRLLVSGVAATDVFTTATPQPAVSLAAPVPVVHGFVSGDPVKFIPDNVGDTDLPTPPVLPGGLDPTLVYYVIAAGLTTTAFKVSATQGGATIDFTAALGQGTMTVQKQDTLFVRVPSTGVENATANLSASTFNLIATSS